MSKDDVRDVRFVTIPGVMIVTSGGAPGAYN